MKGSDRMILLALPLLAIAIGFWLLVLSPKQKEAAELQERIDTAQARLDAAEAQVVAAEQARAAFPDNYADLVKLGPAVPEDDDQSTLIYDDVRDRPRELGQLPLLRGRRDVRRGRAAGAGTGADGPRRGAVGFGAGRRRPPRRPGHRGERGDPADRGRAWDRPASP